MSTRRIALILNFGIVIAILNIKMHVHADEWKNWKPKNEFEELSLMLRDYEQNCTKNISFNSSGEVLDFKYVNSKSCISEHNKIWDYIYKNFPMIKSGEI